MKDYNVLWQASSIQEHCALFETASDDSPNEGNTLAGQVFVRVRGGVGDILHTLKKIATIYCVA